MYQVTQVHKSKCTAVLYYHHLNTLDFTIQQLLLCADMLQGWIAKRFLANFIFYFTSQALDSLCLLVLLLSKHPFSVSVPCEQNHCSYAVATAVPIEKTAV